MAHTCPYCGMVCHCQGDIDDIVMDTVQTYAMCEHGDIYPQCNSELDDED